MKKINYLLILFLIVPFLNGQHSYPKQKPVIVKSVGFLNLPFPQVGNKSNNRMDMMMTWRLTNDLDLKPEQADKFFPRFKVHREKMAELEKETVAISEKLQNKIDRGRDISVKEFEVALENLNQLEIKKIEEKERFVNEMSEYLTTNQLAKLALYKHYFIKDLRREIRKKPRGDN